METLQRILKSSGLRRLYLVSTFFVIIVAIVSYANAQPIPAETTEPTFWFLGKVDITWATVLSFLFVPFAWFVTEITPVQRPWKPMLPFLIGCVAAAFAYFVFGLDPQEALNQFFAALAAGNMNGFIKKLLPALLARYRARSDDDNAPPV